MFINGVNHDLTNWFCWVVLCYTQPKFLRWYQSLIQDSLISTIGSPTLYPCFICSVMSVKGYVKESHIELEMTWQSFYKRRGTILTWQNGLWGCFSVNTNPDFLHGVRTCRIERSHVNPRTKSKKEYWRKKGCKEIKLWIIVYKKDASLTL